MTRETKIGVAVAGSFLGLVAAVVVLRMGNVEESSATTDVSAQTASTDSRVSAIDLRAVPPKSQEIVPASYQSGNPLPPSDNKKPIVAGPTSDSSTDILGGIQLPPPIPTPTKIPVVAVPASGPPPSLDLNASVSHPPAAAKNVPTSATANTRAKTDPPPVVVGPSDSGIFSLPPPAVPATAKQNQPSQDDDKQKTVKDELKKQLGVSTQAVPTSDKQTGSPPIPNTGGQAQANETVKPVIPVPSSGKAPTDITASPPAPTAAGADLPLPPAPTPIAKEGNLVPPPAPDATVKGPPVGSDVPPPPTRIPEKAAPAPTAVASGPKATDNPGMSDRSRPMNLGGEAQPPPQPPASVTTPPPVGAPPTGNSAPIRMPTATASAGNGPAKVQSYDTETHSCKPGENTFADLSKSLYGSDKYAPALLLFNREHPLVGDSFRDSAPRLKPGQQVVVPPLWVLEQPRYANPPPEPRASVAPPSRPAAVTAPPAPAAPPSVPAVAAPTPTPSLFNNSSPPKTAAVSGSRVYTVRGNGEMLYEIARQMLGDGKRWSEIYRLNPDIRPELAIPGGTQLRLPGDARIGS